jgi:hypothetical protein
LGYYITEVSEGGKPYLRRNEWLRRTPNNQNLIRVLDSDSWVQGSWGRRSRRGNGWQSSLQIIGREQSQWISWRYAASIGTPSYWGRRLVKKERKHNAAGKKDLREWEEKERTD